MGEKIESWAGSIGRVNILEFLLSVSLDLKLTIQQ